MQQLSALDAQFLNIEDSVTTGHIASLTIVDPSTAADPDGWGLDAVRDMLEPRLSLAAPFRQKLAEVPLGLGRPFWVDDDQFDIEYHLREIALPAPGSDRMLAEQISRIHARPLDRRRPLWEAYVITGLEGGRAAFYCKIHHAAIDGVSGGEILEQIFDLTPEPREVEPEPFGGTAEPGEGRLLRRGLWSLATLPLDLALTVPRELPYLASIPGLQQVPGVKLVSGVAGVLGRVLGQDPLPDRSAMKVPDTPLNGEITPHRRFAFGSVDLADVKKVKDAYGATVNDVVMTMTAAALRRWLLDHDALPSIPLVAAVPVSVRTGDSGDGGAPGNEVSVMLAQLPTHLRDPRERLEFTAEAMQSAKARFDPMPATLMTDMAKALPMGLNGLAARTIFRLGLQLTGLPFNLFVSNVPGPQTEMYVAGAQVQGIYPVSAISELSGALNVTLFSYNGAVDFGLVADRTRMPDVWKAIDYLREALEELVATIE